MANVLDELLDRGYIKQFTHEEETRELLEKEKITFYIGFDPTADSLHVGHFVSLTTRFLTSNLSAVFLIRIESGLYNNRTTTETLTVLITLNNNAQYQTLTKSVFPDSHVPPKATANAGKFKK